MTSASSYDRVRVLLVEDNPADADLVREYIEAEGTGNQFDVCHVVRLRDALQQLRERTFDVILTDFNLPDGTGIGMLEELRRHVPATPIVVITGTSNDMGLALDALRHGAQDYLIKGAASASIHRALRYAIERKQMEDALTRSETQLRRQNALLEAILDNMADGVVVADREGKMLVLNPAAQRIYGVGLTDAGPEEWSTTYGTLNPETTTPMASYDLPLVRAILGKSSDNVEIIVRRRDLAKDAYIQSTGRPLRDSSGEVYGGMVVLHDITAYKETEETLRQKNEELTSAYAELDRSRREQLELKDQVLSHVSHELRTPLNAVYQFVTILKRGLAGPLQPEQQAHLEDIERNLNQLRTMISDLLETSRAESGKLTIRLRRFELQATVDDVVRMMQSAAAGKRLALRADLPGDLPRVVADPDRVRQVLTNLLDNAQKFTPEGGAITVRAAVSPREVGFVRVSVTDTGRGIAPSDHDRIFSRMAQVNAGSEESRKGLGLGLFICREIIRRLGGDIGVESTLGAGSTFYFTLPTDVNPEAAQQGRAT